MIDNFTALKQQLRELAAVLNEFKSETVQLRILEFVLSGEVPHEDKPDTNHTAKKKRASKKNASVAAKKPTAGDAAKPKKVRPAGSGAGALLVNLVDGDFFQKPRTINDIVEYFKVNQARTIKPNEISGKLGRLVRDGKLKRKKNAENQFEYSKA